MPGKGSKRNIIAGPARRGMGATPPVRGLAGGNPDRLREIVFHTLTELPPDERRRLRDSLLYDLEKAGVNLVSGLVKLGIPATEPDDLSPSDVAKLVRYVYLNKPDAMAAVSAGLGGQMAVGGRIDKSTQPLEKAA